MFRRFGFHARAAPPASPTVGPRIKTGVGEDEDSIKVLEGLFGSISIFSNVPSAIEVSSTHQSGLRKDLLTSKLGRSFNATSDYFTSCTRSSLTSI
jgi:hypothetical protein